MRRHLSEADPFEQSEQKRRCESRTNGNSKVLPHHAVSVEMNKENKSLCTAISRSSDGLVGTVGKSELNY